MHVNTMQCRDQQHQQHAEEETQDIEEVGADVAKHLQTYTPGTWVVTTVVRPHRGDCAACQCATLFGVLEQYLPDRGRWALRLTSGQLCAVKVEQIALSPFQPFQRKLLHIQHCVQIEISGTTPLTPNDLPGNRRGSDRQ